METLEFNLSVFNCIEHLYAICISCEEKLKFGALKKEKRNLSQLSTNRKLYSLAILYFLNV